MNACKFSASISASHHHPHEDIDAGLVPHPSTPIRPFLLPRLNSFFFFLSTFWCQQKAVPKLLTSTFSWKPKAPCRGCVLSPLLFAVYERIHFSGLSVPVMKFSDDTNYNN